MTCRVVSVQVGHVREAGVQGERAGRWGSTAIDKRPVDHRVAVGPLGLTGDAQADHTHHGGPDKAVYAYAREDAAFWSRELAREVPAGAFGENLALAALDLTGAVIGERWVIGSTLLEVRGPRTPCWKLAGFWRVPDLVKRFTSAVRPGAYLGVVEPGDVGAGDEIRVVHRPAHGVTVGEVFRARTLERHLVPRLLEAPELPGDIRAWAANVLAADGARPR